MPNIEKVLNGLEHCIKKLDSVIDNTHGFDCISCSYFRKCESIGHLVGLPLMLDALALLEAQEPRILTLDDIATWVRQKPMDREPIYVEVKDLLGAWGAWMVDEIASYLPETDLSGELYGKTWRCWSARPTDEQRKKVEWDD